MFYAGIFSKSYLSLQGKENKRRLQTLSIDNAWSNKHFLVYLTFCSFVCYNIHLQKWTVIAVTKNKEGN